VRGSTAAAMSPGQEPSCTTLSLGTVLSGRADELAPLGVGRPEAVSGGGEEWDLRGSPAFRPQFCTRLGNCLSCASGNEKL